MEYEYEVVYKKGSENQIAEAWSRIPKNCETTMNPSKDIPCYMCASEAAETGQAFCNAVHHVEAVLDIEKHDLTALSLEELLSEQATD